MPSRLLDGASPALCIWSHHLYFYFMRWSQFLSLNSYFFQKEYLRCDLFLFCQLTDSLKNFSPLFFFPCSFLSPLSLMHSIIIFLLLLLFLEFFSFWRFFISCRRSLPPPHFFRGLPGLVHRLEIMSFISSLCATIIPPPQSLILTCPPCSTRWLLSHFLLFNVAVGTLSSLDPPHLTHTSPRHPFSSTN